MLVFNCHEAWVYQLGWLGYPLDIIIGLKGRHTAGWDHRIRPVPPGARLLSLPQALASKSRYYCIIAHNITDLLDVKHRPEPRLLVLHSTIEGRIAEEKARTDAGQLRAMLHRYLQLTGCHAIATSGLKLNSWGLAGDDDVVPFGVDPDDYLPYTGEKPCGLRICNFVASRRRILLWDLHEKAFADVPIRLVGHNPGIPGAAASRNWDHLKVLLQSHRFYVHTADPACEDGYNMATVEAMAAAMPVLTNTNPSCPIEHGVSGFVSDDPAELGRYARMLLNDRDLAASMGEKARQSALQRFSVDRFRQRFLRAIEKARQKWKTQSTTDTDAP